MVMFRGALQDAELQARLRDALGIEIPARLSIWCSDGIDVAWMAPDELLLMSDENGSSLADKVRNSLPDTHHLAVDVTGMRAEFEVVGPIRDVLAKGTPADVSRRAFAVGSFRRSRVAQIQTAFWLLDESTLRMICRRSEAEYVSRWLEMASAEGRELGFHHRDRHNRD